MQHKVPGRNADQTTRCPRFKKAVHVQSGEPEGSACRLAEVYSLVFRQS